MIWRYQATVKMVRVRGMIATFCTLIFHMVCYACEILVYQLDRYRFFFGVCFPSCSSSFPFSTLNFFQKKNCSFYQRQTVFWPFFCLGNPIFGSHGILCVSFLTRINVFRCVCLFMTQNVVFVFVEIRYILLSSHHTLYGLRNKRALTSAGFLFYFEYNEDKQTAAIFSLKVQM